MTDLYDYLNMSAERRLEENYEPCESWDIMPDSLITAEGMFAEELHY